MNILNTQCLILDSNIFGYGLWLQYSNSNTNSNSNSASVTVTGPTRFTGPSVIKFGYKEFTVKGQRRHAGYRQGC